MSQLEPVLSAETLFDRLCGILLGDGEPSARQLGQLTALADQHCVLGLLHERCMSKNIPEHQTLTDRALHAAALQIRKDQQLQGVIDSFASNGVPSLVFKGAALAHSHYPRPELRERDDSDLALRIEHLPQAHQLLLQLGYQETYGNEGSMIMHQRLYRRLDSDGVLHNLDLHWAIHNSVHTAPFDIRQLLCRSAPLNALGIHARRPDDIDALLIACAHLDAHHVADVRLVWLYDLELICRTLDSAARAKVCERALEQGLTNACAWVLSAARACLGTSLLGFERLLAGANVEPPSTGRLAQWQRELSALPSLRAQLTWLRQHVLPSARYLRASSDSKAALWRLNVARWKRGIAHLSR